jgi:ribose-phosphate pyrophosphokinase
LEESRGQGNYSIVSPDVGGVERARSFATRLYNADIAVIDKRRSGPNQIAEMKVVGDVRGRRCIIVDDIVDTGGTLIKAAESLLKEGAVDVRACCVHPVLSGNAFERLQASPLSEIIVTDTIPIPRPTADSKFKVISIAPLVAEAIRRIHAEDSVSGLFR